MTLCEIFQALLQPATPISSSVVHQNFCSFLSLCCLLSYYSRDTFFKKEKMKRNLKTKNSPTKKVPLLYGEKFPFCSGVFQIFYTLFTFDFTTAKKYPSIIRRKSSVLLMCFERKFTIYFIKTKILTVFIDEDLLPVPLFVQLTKKFVFVL